jgi:hypothetical protein
MFAILMLVAAAQAATLMTHTSSPLNDYNPSLDAAERVMVFARSEADFRNARILETKRKGRMWSRPAPISFSSGPFSDSDPWITPDARTLYFISDRPGPGREEGRSDYDIWRSKRTANGWAAPERLGSEVNGRGQELGPELHGGVLYFSSARRSGKGGLDIYQAPVRGSKFGTATLVEGPFNSAASDSDFTLRRDGQAAMFWRSQGERGIIHIAYRKARRWSEPVPLSAKINAGPFNFTPTFSHDGRRIRYASTLDRSGQQSGLADIYEAQLERVIPGR